MVKMNAVYQGELFCKVTHTPSGSEILTNAPVDNGGRGEKFSPTDLVGAALGACMLTVMALVADRRQVSLQGASVLVTKEMIKEPVRRIGSLSVEFTMPKGLSAENRKVLERAALTCPVHQSLHPDVKIPVNFNYSD